jgi:6-phosphofructokinase 1
MLYLLGNVDACRDAHKIQQAAIERKMKLSVIIVPKSIENNFPFIDKCIGFDTIVQGAVEAIDKVWGARTNIDDALYIYIYTRRGN